MMSDISITSLEEAELELWFSHTAECFAWKGTPKTHFENHFYLDPFRSVEDILVAKVGSKIVSSVRIFVREMYVDGRIVKIGGIGEVTFFLSFFPPSIFDMKVVGLHPRLVQRQGLLQKTSSRGYLQNARSRFQLRIAALFQRTDSGLSICWICIGADEICKSNF